jgi:uncharacterized protein YukE
MNTPNQTLITCVGNTHALITHGLEAIDRQLENLDDKSRRHPDAYAALQEVHRTLEAQASALELRRKALGGGGAQPFKDAVSSIAGHVSGLIHALREEEASHSLRDDYTFLARASVGYVMLHATARSLGDQETAALAETCYRDIARLTKQVDRVLPALVIQELREEGLVVSEMSRETLAMVKRAWEGDAAVAG